MCQVKKFDSNERFLGISPFFNQHLGACNTQKLVFIIFSEFFTISYVKFAQKWVKNTKKLCYNDLGLFKKRYAAIKKKSDCKVGNRRTRTTFFFKTVIYIQ